VKAPSARPRGRLPEGGLGQADPEDLLSKISAEKRPSQIACLFWRHSATGYAGRFRKPFITVWVLVPSAPLPGFHPPTNPGMPPPSRVRVTGDHVVLMPAVFRVEVKLIWLRHVCWLSVLQHQHHNISVKRYLFTKNQHHDLQLTLGTRLQSLLKTVASCFWR